MRINRVQHTNFKGLWGAKTYYSPYKGIVELDVADKYYPFQDDTEDIIRKEIKELWAQKTHGEEFDIFDVPFVIDIEESLPFTRREFISYKDKNHGKQKKLTDKDREVESYLLYGDCLGLNAYINQYKRRWFGK